MGILALILGMLGGLCTTMGFITALAVIPEVIALRDPSTWMF